jgi:hypothetical protein
MPVIARSLAAVRPTGCRELRCLNLGIENPRTTNSKEPLDSRNARCNEGQTRHSPGNCQFRLDHALDAAHWLEIAKPTVSPALCQLRMVESTQTLRVGSSLATDLIAAQTWNPATTDTLCCQRLPIRGM